MDPEVIQDPVFQDLLLRYEVAHRKLRDVVISMRSFYLTHHKRPLDETTSEKWHGAILAEDACRRHETVKSAAADLLRYAFELAPHSNNPLHLEEVMKLKMAARERTEKRGGHNPERPILRGIEEQALIDGGPPVTIVYKPSAYEFTDRGKKAAQRKKPAMPLEEGCAKERDAGPPPD